MLNILLVIIAIVGISVVIEHLGDIISFIIGAAVLVIGAICTWKLMVWLFSSGVIGIIIEIAIIIVVILVALFVIFCAKESLTEKINHIRVENLKKSLTKRINNYYRVSKNCSIKQFIIELESKKIDDHLQELFNKYENISTYEFAINYFKNLTQEERLEEYTCAKKAIDAMLNYRVKKEQYFSIDNILLEIPDVESYSMPFTNYGNNFNNYVIKEYKQKVNGVLINKMSIFNSISLKDMISRITDSPIGICFKYSGEDYITKYCYELYENQINSYINVYCADENHIYIDEFCNQISQYFNMSLFDDLNINNGMTQIKRAKQIFRKQTKDKRKAVYKTARLNINKALSETVESTPHIPIQSICESNVTNKYERDFRNYDESGSDFNKYVFDYYREEVNKKLNRYLYTLGAATLHEFIDFVAGTDYNEYLQGMNEEEIENMCANILETSDLDIVDLENGEILYINKQGGTNLIKRTFNMYSDNCLEEVFLPEDTVVEEAVIKVGLDEYALEQLSKAYEKYI